MNSFEFNKIVGAVLATIFVLFGGSILAEGLFRSEAPETPGYEIVAAEAEAGGAEDGAAKAEETPIAALLQTADAEAGAGQFKKCAACHTGEKGGANKVGPHLWDVVNRPIASVSDFAYSAGMTEFSQGGSVNWDYDHLNGFLKNPKGYVSGTAMGFAGLKDPEARAELIAYLRTLADSPAPLPEAPAEGAAPAEAPADAAAPAQAAAEGAAPAETAAADPATTTQPEEATKDAQAQAPAVTDTEAAQPAPGTEVAPTQAAEGEAQAPAAGTPAEAAPATAEQPAAA
ncbi:MAG TPA: cytochrome c family protein, partial [Aurantimonas coralicida]|nr:cytochrome c family protein [Aurantimonas coralicida]